MAVVYGFIGRGGQISVGFGMGFLLEKWGQISEKWGQSKNSFDSGENKQGSDRKFYSDPIFQKSDPIYSDPIFPLSKITRREFHRTQPVAQVYQVTGNEMNDAIAFLHVAYHTD